MTRLVGSIGSVCLALAVLLTFGCTARPDGSTSHPTGTAARTRAASASTNRGSSVQANDTVRVDVPAWYFAEATDADIQTGAKDSGYASATVHADRSVTYLMKEAKRVEVLKDLEAGLPATVAGLTKGKDAVPAFLSADHNADFSQFVIKADASKYSVIDGMWANVLLMGGTNLQALRGVPVDRNRVTVQIVDAQSGKLLLSVDSASLK